jgi:hypothetical protein
VALDSPSAQEIRCDGKGAQEIRWDGKEDGHLVALDSPSAQEIRWDGVLCCFCKNKQKSSSSFGSQRKPSPFMYKTRHHLQYIFFNKTSSDPLEATSRNFSLGVHPQTPHPTCPSDNQSHSRVLHCLHYSSSEGNLGDDLRHDCQADSSTWLTAHQE